MTISEQAKKNIEEFNKQLRESLLAMHVIGVVEKRTTDSAIKTMYIYVDEIQSKIKEAQLSIIDVMIEGLNNNFSKNIQYKEKHGQPLFWDVETETDGWNNAIQDQIDYLKAEKAIIKNI